MPHARTTGTAWDKTLDDYAYARNLDRPGWAWEFLRRNHELRRDERIGSAGTPRPIMHVSGARYFKCHRRFPLAERWHLQFFPNPLHSALDTDVFWLPEAVTRQIKVRLDPGEASPRNGFSLDDFSCRCAVLCTAATEHVIVRHGPESVRLSARGLSILHGCRPATFEVDGYVETAKPFEALQGLVRLARGQLPTGERFESVSVKWRDYLIALDGHLAGRSYRDIAEVIYGSHRIKESWSDDTRSLKDRVRRAVERGVVLMERDYVTLL